LGLTKGVLCGGQTELNGHIADHPVIEDDALNGVSFVADPRMNTERFFVEREFFGGGQQQRVGAFCVVDTMR